jgi:hypothetical protein
MDDPRRIRSVWIHLSGLHTVFAYGALPSIAGRVMRDLSVSGLSVPKIPAGAPALDVRHVRRAVDRHAEASREWAEEVWRYWSPNFPAIQARVGLALDGTR